VRLQVNNEWRDVPTDRLLFLTAGERVTLTRGILHAFWADSEFAIVGEISTANDDTNDNFFENPAVGRFSRIVEDEPAIVKLVSD
jgi:D-lyxose ketol-isomerase